MAKIEDFCRGLTDQDWEALSVEIAAASKTEEAAEAFAKKYGFKHLSIRAYENQHYIELEKREKMLAELRAELTSSTSTEKGYPSFRPIKGSSVKANFYATQPALDLFNKYVNDIVERYCYKRYLAAAFVLEEALKRLGPIPKDKE